MNNIRRKGLSVIIDKLQKLQYELESIATDERDAFDSLSEGLQASMMGQTLEENSDKLDDATALFDEIIELIEDVM